MRWPNLQQYKCPKCDGDLKQRNNIHVCTKCDFGVKDEKLNKIVKDMNPPQKRSTALSPEDETQDALNKF